MASALMHLALLDLPTVHQDWTSASPCRKKLREGVG
jgi:hypothetical protein